MQVPCMGHRVLKHSTAVGTSYKTGAGNFVQEPVICRSAEHTPHGVSFFVFPRQIGVGLHAPLSRDIELVNY